MLTMRTAVAALLIGLAGFATPAAAQFSDSYNFFKAVKEKDAAKAVSLMSQPGSTLVALRDFDTGEQALHIVTKRRDLGWMSLLLAKGAPIDGRDRAGNTALVTAAGLNFSDGVRLLITRKANVNLANSRGETALIKAVQARDIASVRALLEAGADPDLSDSVAGMSARDYADQDRRASAIQRLIKDGIPVKPTTGPAAGAP